MDNLLKNKNLTNLLSVFDTDVSDLRPLLKAEGLITPERLIDYLVDNANDIADSRKDFFKQHFKAALSRDNLLGAYSNSMSTIIDDIARECSEVHDDTFIIEIDISNMGNSNDAIGMKNVDSATRIMSHYYEQEIKKLGGEVQTLRKGGDEIRYYVQGISEEKLQQAMKKAGQKATEFSRQLLTEKLTHSKENSPAGFDVGAGYISAKKGADQAEQQQVLEKNIKDDKYGKSSKRNHMKPVKFSEVDAALVGHPEIDRKTAIIADNLSKALTGKAFTVNPQSAMGNLNADKLKPKNFHNNSIRTHTIEVINRELKELELDKTISQARELPKELQPELSALENAEQARNAKALTYATNNQISDKESNILFAGCQFYNDRCAITGLRGARDYIADTDRFKGSDEEPQITTIFNLENLSGVNSSLNTKNADLVIGRYAEIVENVTISQFGEDIAERLYRIDAGRIALNTAGISHAELQHLSATIANQVESEMNNMVFKITTQNDNQNNQYTIITDTRYQKTHPDDKQRNGATISAISINANQLPPENTLNIARFIKDTISARRDSHNLEDIKHTVEQSLALQDRRLHNKVLDYSFTFSQRPGNNFSTVSSEPTIRIGGEKTPIRQDVRRANYRNYIKNLQQTNSTTDEHKR